MLTLIPTVAVLLTIAAIKLSIVLIEWIMDMVDIYRHAHRPPETVVLHALPYFVRKTLLAEIDYNRDSILEQLTDIDATHPAAADAAYVRDLFLTRVSESIAAALAARASGCAWSVHCPPASSVRHVLDALAAGRPLPRYLD